MAYTSLKAMPTTDLTLDAVSRAVVPLEEEIQPLDQYTNRICKYVLYLNIKRK